MSDEIVVSEPSTAVDGVQPREPEKLILPPEAVGDLLMAAIRSQEGNAFWRGFVAAHGFPSWIVQGRWRLAVSECAILPGEPGQVVTNGAVRRG